MILKKTKFINIIKSKQRFFINKKPICVIIVYFLLNTHIKEKMKVIEKVVEEVEKKTVVIVEIDIVDIDSVY
jgi:hypothetical protein